LVGVVDEPLERRLEHLNLQNIDEQEHTMYLVTARDALLT
jgi:hypothetical protein